MSADTQCICGFVRGSVAVGSKPCPVHDVKPRADTRGMRELAFEFAVKEGFRRPIDKCLTDALVTFAESIVEQCCKDWLVWSCEHQLWWRANRCGYTAKVDEAGRYTLTDALRCCEGRSPRDDGKPNEIPVPSPELIELIRSRWQRGEEPLPAPPSEADGPHQEGTK